MITIISASGREGNNTKFIAKACKKVLTNFQQEVQILSFDMLPGDISVESIHKQENSMFSELAAKYIAPAEKLIFVIPEYNGSFPGMLKVFIDAIHPKTFKGKKAALMGVSTGRAGNLRGMDHLTDILHYLEVEVMSLKVPFSRVHTLLDEKGNITDEYTKEIIQVQMERFVKY